MTLTPEQEQFFEEAHPGGVVKPSGEQTQEQAENLAVASFMAACDFAGMLPLPTEADVRAKLIGSP